MGNILDLIIVGGGAGGLFAGVQAGKLGLKTVILEAQDKPGKKLLATGNGKCNICNSNLTGWEYNKNYAYEILNKTPVCEILEDFKELGIMVYADNEGRNYPCSNSSHSVLASLLNALSVLNVNVKNNSQVKRISKIDNLFNVETNGFIFQAKNVLISTGGNACKLAEKLGHKITKMSPSLVGIKTKENLSVLAGTRVGGACVKLTYNSEKLPLISGVNSEVSNNAFTERGEIIFRENGISGICVFNCSSIINRYSEIPKISLDLMPQKSESQIVEMLKESNRNIFTKGNRILFGLLPEKLCKYLIKNCASENDIAKKIKKFTLEFAGFLENNQVTSGGVELSQVNSVESKLVPGLYLSGEVLDIDGICGGYNLQFAFSSAKCAVKEIAKKRR